MDEAEVIKIIQAQAPRLTDAQITEKAAQMSSRDVAKQRMNDLERRLSDADSRHNQLSAEIRDSFKTLTVSITDFHGHIERSKSEVLKEVSHAFVPKTDFIELQGFCKTLATAKQVSELKSDQRIMAVKVALTVSALTTFATGLLGYFVFK